MEWQNTEASMGPRFGGAENFADPDEEVFVEQASMGPRFGGAENSVRRGKSEVGDIASMGPRFGGAENHVLEVIFTQVGEASMGPRFGGAENTPAPIRLHRRDGLQWGRALGARKTRCCRGFYAPRSSFNGAALWGRGKRVGVGDSTPLGVASMGPRFGGAENRLQASSICLIACFNGAALWGRGKRQLPNLIRQPDPRFNGAALWGRGKQRGDDDGEDRSTSFNGAALWGRGKRDYLKRRQAKLQRFNGAALWGRGKHVCRRGSQRREKASMGPRFGGAENDGFGEGYIQPQRLQWGRALGARKTTFPCRRMMSCMVMLQWGRALGARKTPNIEP